MDRLCGLDHGVKPLLDRIDSADRRLRNAVRTGSLQDRDSSIVGLAQPVELRLLRVRWTYSVIDALDWQVGQSGLLSRTGRCVRKLGGPDVWAGIRPDGIEPRLLLVAERIVELHQPRAHHTGRA